ncbi:MAG: peptidylprolyl isomerase [Candidatus Coatesbacteria bacterium]|nr:MAG: peptidylprolyl isomerase [Candidatus Coatesbacteria bacterium]
MKSTLAFAAMAVAATLAFVACQKGPAVEEEKIVARVGDAVLTAEDLARLDRDQRKVKLPAYLSKEELMAEWIRSEVLYQNALEEGVDRDEECAWRLLNSRKGIVIQRFWELELYEKIPELSEDEALVWYEENKEERFKAKMSGVWLRRIMLPSKEDADAVLERLERGEDFETLARTISVTPEKLRGGDQGYRRLEDLSPIYRDAVAKTKEGGVAGPFKVAQYYILLKVEDHVEPGDYLLPAGIGMESLREKAKVETWRAKAAEIGEELVAAADIERHPERIPDEIAEMALGEEVPGTAGTAE